jgi:hypothetical protein
MNDTPFLERPKPNPERYDTHVADKWVSENQFIAMTPDFADLPSLAQVRDILPDPFWTGHPEVNACYWRAWELAFSNLKRPTPENDFAANYCDTAFNGNLFMWDSSFITCFGVYGRRAFNFQKTLDTFYRKQHPDGFICREISESDGQDTFPRFDPSSTGPNILAWAEWNYFTKSGDRQRLETVFPPLVAYHHWMRKHRTWPDGSYWSTGWGTGMDNLPRVRQDEHINFDNGHLTWVDATFQALLSARILLQIATLLGRDAEVEDLGVELEGLIVFSNQQLWNNKSKFYCDRLPNGDFLPMKHIGAFWALLAGCVPEDRIPGFVAHLEDPSEFNRAHRIPALSADDPHYSGTGGYWCGGVWAPTNYMVLKGLDISGQDALAHEIAKNHLGNVVQVFKSDDTPWLGADQFRNYFHLTDLKYDDKHTLWENKPGYVGWTGVPPIAVLLEDVFGLSPDAVSNRLTWHVRLIEEHGVHRYPFGETGSLELKCNSRNSRLDRPTIEIHSNLPLTLEVIWEGGTYSVNIEKEP